MCTTTTLLFDVKMCTRLLFYFGQTVTHQTWFVVRLQLNFIANKVVKFISYEIVLQYIANSNFRIFVHSHVNTYNSSSSFGSACTQECDGNKATAKSNCPSSFPRAGGMVAPICSLHTIPCARAPHPTSKFKNPKAKKIRAMVKYSMNGSDYIAFVLLVDRNRGLLAMVNSNFD
jgi:hypothetical protein